MLLYTSIMSDSEVKGGSPAEEEVKEEVTIVLAAIDTSSSASRVIEMAARIARRTWHNTQLHIVHVYRSGRFDRPSRAGLHREELIADARSYLEHHVRMARKQCPSPVTGHFAEGDPADEILRCARSISADLLLVGTSDPAGLERFLLGSVATEIGKTAPCSVVIVSEKQKVT
jgi:nucleotide-binding universal stress UspA family protein